MRRNAEVRNPEVVLHNRRAADRASESAITPEQVKAGRELLGWSQLDLANELGVSETAISLFEREKRRLLVVDVLQLRAALESAGVEFLDAGDAGVRLKSKTPEMPLEEFSTQLEGYEQQQLRPKGISLNNRGVKFGFALLHMDRASATLMLEGRELGRIKWNEGTVEFSPPIPGPDGRRNFEEKLEQWATEAYARSLPDGDAKPVPNFRLFAPRVEDSREAPQSAGSAWLRRSSPAK